jgi:hypothetical protein
MTTLWAAKWSTTNELDGHREYIYIGAGTPKIFRTRQECRDFIEYEWGYIRNRPDLKREPHCWRVPKAVKVKVVEE